ncbi:MAG TPA: glucose-6-phosphate isomerase family protein [Armatimonadota bacterium]|jgi:glucose-6-phosphate isomerase
MIDLTSVAGLPLKFDEQTNAFSPGAGVRDPLYATRELDALRPILADPDCEGPEIIYWMYRNLGLKGDERLLQTHRLRYDISTFVPCKLGREPMKTSGHYHPPVYRGGPAYPEIYEVLYGEALYLLQKVADYEAGPGEVQVEDIFTLRVKAGEKAMMPPGYGHVTINTLDEPLVMCNWVCADFNSFYGSTEQCRGFAYWLFEEQGETQWVRNPAYPEPVPALRHATPRAVPELGLEPGVPMYTVCREHPELFAFLLRPQDFEAQMWQALEFS